MSIKTLLGHIHLVEREGLLVCYDMLLLLVKTITAATIFIIIIGGYLSAAHICD